MSEITRFFSWDGNGFMHEGADGDYVLHEDHKAEVERLTVRLEHAQARIVPPLPHADESAQQVQDKMDGYIASLTTELHETREKLARVQVQYDEFAKVTAKVIDKHQRERDHARQQVYLLQQAGADRPTDEDFWREAFMTLLPSYPWEKAAEHADRALAEYRKRWPR